MNRRTFARLAAQAALFGACGCGPMLSPMPTRLDEASQASFDSAWNHVLTPISRANHKQLLDVVLSNFALQLGVDRLQLRSEKDFAGGIVIMEVSYDRLRPAADALNVTVLGHDRRVLRLETYDRTAVERAQSELGAERLELRDLQLQGLASPTQLERLATLDARAAFLAEAFTSHLFTEAETGATAVPDK